MNIIVRFGLVLAFCVPAVFFPHEPFAQQTGIAVGSRYIPISPGSPAASLPLATPGAVEPGNTRIGTTGVGESGATRVLTTGTVGPGGIGEAQSGHNREAMTSDTDNELIAAYGASAAGLRPRPAEMQGGSP